MKEREREREREERETFIDGGLPPKNLSFRVKGVCAEKAVEKEEERPFEKWGDDRVRRITW